MNALEALLFSYSKNPIQILDSKIPINKYVPLDLSENNAELKSWDIMDPINCQSYIDKILREKGGTVAYGGYLEKRNLYSDKTNFTNKKEEPRNVHLGIDYWAVAGTKVITPLDGIIHSFKNNDTMGDYGPTIILEHHLDKTVFYTLYGHLTIESLKGLSVGKKVKAQSVLAALGTPDINVNYAPHLHFQIISDLEGNYGDYPGVCAQKHLDFYKNNCPDPNILLKIG